MNNIAKLVDSNPPINFAEISDRLNTYNLVYNKDLVELTPTKWTENSRWNCNFWLKKESKKNELIYESLFINAVYEQIKNSYSSYSYPSNKLLGYSLNYQKRLAFSDDAYKITKSGKKDEKIYTLEEINNLPLLEIKFNMSGYQNEYKGYRCGNNSKKSII